MKRIFTLTLLMSFFAFASAQNANPAPEPLSLKESIYNFGKIPQGKPVYHYFEVTNTGNEPLVITNIQTSCGCTTPEWSKEPVAPGTTTKIKVGFNAAAQGPFDKYITIQYNKDQTKQVRISGEVWKAPDTPAPMNASIQLLKQIN